MTPNTPRLQAITERVRKFEAQNANRWLSCSFGTATSRQSSYLSPLSSLERLRF